MKEKGLVWFRSDLRLRDNEAVTQAVRCCDEVDYVYVFDERVWQGRTRYGFPKMGKFRKKFLTESIQDLERQIKGLGGRLHIRYGRPETILADWVIEHKNSWIFCNRERTQEEVRVQDRLEQKLWTLGREMRYSRGKMLYHTADLPFPVTHTPDQFTTFRKEVERITELRPPLPIPPDLKSGTLPLEQEWPPMGEKVNEVAGVFSFTGGSQAAEERLQFYCGENQLLGTYKMTRNELLGDSFSSRFSPWLADGSISPKHIMQEVREYEDRYGANDSSYWMFFELLWRDFFRLMGKKHGNRIFQEKGYHRRPRPAGEEHKELFKKWACGQTGTPLVDAAMIELNATGWMPNRVRQIVASFLVNDLGVHWLMGAEYFESMLIDYDPCSNYGNWAYIAGVGSDTRSDRYFNLLSQATKYDPKGDYVRFWIDELKEFHGFKVHALDQLPPTDEQDHILAENSIYRNPLISSKKW